VDFEKVLVDAGACDASRPAKKAKCEGDEGGDAACGGDNVSDNTSQPDSDKRKKKVVDFNIWSTIEKARFERECASLASSLIEFNQEVQKAIDCHNAQLLTNLEEADHADPEKLTKQELLDQTGALASVLDGAISAGLVEPKRIYSEHDAIVIKSVVDASRFGLEPRHLRGMRLAVDREVGLVSQAVSASGGASKKMSKDEFREKGRELSDILTTLRQVLTRDAINKLES